MSTVKVHKARQGMPLRERSHLAGHCSSGGRSSGRQGHAACVYCVDSDMDICLCSDRSASHCLRPGGHGWEVGEGWGSCREVMGITIVVGQNIGAAAASSFALLLCSICSFSPHWLERAEAKWSLCWF